jgi:hypothetical protein
MSPEQDTNHTIRARVATDLTPVAVDDHRVDVLDTEFTDVHDI